MSHNERCDILRLQKFLMTPEYDDYGEGEGDDQLGFKPEARKAEELRRKERRKKKEELRQKVYLTQVVSSSSRW